MIRLSVPVFCALLLACSSAETPEPQTAPDASSEEDSALPPRVSEPDSSSQAPPPVSEPEAT